MAKGRNARARRILLALLFAGTAWPAFADSVSDSTSDATSDATQSAGAQQPQDIIVTGQALFRDIRPETELDQDAIDSYGVGTVDELLSEVEAEIGEEEAPLILVNGERVGGVDDIGGYPVEVLRNVQVLPRGSAVRMGGTTGQRVINLTLQNKMRSGTVAIAPKIATEGDWHAGRGDGILTYLQGATRANISLRIRDESSLLERERGIIQPEAIRPYAIEGNVLGFPDTSGEIDPLLSALAGEIVTVAPLPPVANPTLGTFAASANAANATDLGLFRTLRPKVNYYDLNATGSTRLAPWLTANATLRLNRNVSRSLRGLPSALFVLPDENPFSPFSRDVTIAAYGRDPLRSRYTRDSGEGRLTFNGTFGQWFGNLNARHSQSKDVIDTDRSATFGFTTLDDDINPFATDLSELIAIQTDRATSRARNDRVELTFNGPLVNLPAGPLQATLAGLVSWNSLHSRNAALVASRQNFHRNEQGFRGALEIPLTSSAAGPISQIGELKGTAEYGLNDYSDAGTLTRWALGLMWDPLESLELRGSVEKSGTPPSMQILGSPVISTPEIRVFDPLTGETVDVTQISGGNPSLRPEKLKVWRLASTVRLMPKYNLQLNAEYTDSNARNFISALPPASAPVMLAFPDRFVRNPDGTLAIVDFRPVNFDSHREKRLRWGLSMRAKIASGNILGGVSRGESAPPETESSEEGQAPSLPISAGRTPSTYFQLTANHTIVFSDKLFIRPGLDRVNLLEGGALGIGGGRVRHQVDATAALTSGGLGARIGVTWRGASTLDTNIGGVSDTLRFSPLFLVNLRLFADARRFLPTSSWAKGLRLSIDVVNLTNDRQRVRDSFGNTPLQYQPAYRDPLGRTIEFEVRKVF